MAIINDRELNKNKAELVDKIMSLDLHGRRIYLLGTAEFGPTNEPVLVKSTAGLKNKFGRFGTLHAAFHAIKYISKDNYVYLVKTTGEHSVAYFNVNTYGGEVARDGFVISASESNEIYNDIYVEVDLTAFSITYPDFFGIEKQVYPYTEYPTIELLANAINKNTRLKKGKVFAYYMVDPATPTQNAFFNCNMVLNYLNGGYCGVGYSKDMLYNCLERTYDMLESEDIDFILPVDACLDDIYPNDTDEEEFQYNMKYYHSDKDYLTPDVFGNPRSFMNQLEKFCVKQLNSGIVTHGIIGYNEMEHISEYLYESDDVVKMLTMCLEWNKYYLEDPFHSFLVTAVAGDLRYNYTEVHNACFAYAAIASSVTVNEGTANIPIDKVGLYNEWTEEALAVLADNGICAFRHSPLYDKPVIYDGVTCCTEDENYKLFANVRMIQMAISYLNKLYQFYIGLDMVRLVKDDIIENDSRTILAMIQSRDIITDFDIQIAPYYYKQHVKVYLTLQTDYMTKSIKAYTEISGEYQEGVA